MKFPCFVHLIKICQKQMRPVLRNSSFISYARGSFSDAKWGHLWSCSYPTEFCMSDFCNINLLWNSINLSILYSFTHNEYFPHIRNSWTAYYLRDAIHQHVPQSFIKFSNSSILFFSQIFFLLLLLLGVLISLVNLPDFFADYFSVSLIQMELSFTGFVVQHG